MKKLICVITIFLATSLEQMHTRLGEYVQKRFLKGVKQSIIDVKQQTFY